MLKVVLLEITYETLAGPTLGPNNRNANIKKSLLQRKNSIVCNKFLNLHVFNHTISQSDRQSISQSIDQ